MSIRLSGTGAPQLLDLHTLAAGVYMVQLESGHLRHTQKLVVQ
jgi:hypothetical protein